jgi:putative DNA primase/helicase
MMTSGFGTLHTNENGKGRPYSSIDLAGIRQLVDHPQDVDKTRAQWVIPSTLKTRNFKAQEKQGQYWMLWADLDKNPRPLVEVKEAMDDVLDNRLEPHNFEIYASKSARQDYQKGRLLIPLAKPLSGSDWLNCQEILNDKLEVIGFTPDRASQGAAQLCNLPNRGDFYEAHSERNGDSFDPLKMWRDEVAAKKQSIAQNKAALEAANKETAKQRAKLKLTFGTSGKPDLISAFNEAFNVQQILLNNNYTQRGNTFRHPKSESGSYSASVKDGRVHSFSSNDPLYTGGGGVGAHDAFSAFMVLQHQGNMKAALKDAGDNFITIGGEPWNKVKQREYMHNKSMAEVDFERQLYTRLELSAMIDVTDDFDELTSTIANLVSTSNLNQSERLSLRKRIAAKAKVSVASLKEDARTYTHSDIGKDTSHLFGARQVIQSFGEGNLIETSGSLWCWRDDGIWRRADDREIKRRVHDVKIDCDITSSIVASVLDLVKTESYKINHQFDENPQTINCANGELEYKDSKWVLSPHVREHYRTSIIPVEYDNKAKAPRFEEFLHEIFDGDDDANEKTLVVMEALGYTLIPSCHLEMFFMLIGGGANGKSVLLTVLKELIGTKSTTAVQPNQFDNRFQRAHLQGKLANIITEIAEGGEIADAQLKSLASGEMTTAEHKHKDPFDFVPYAKHWFGTNHLPRTRDFSDALFRRAIILTFNNKFEGDRRDVHLIDTLKKELPGIFNMALYGLQRLFDNKAFTTCQSSIDISNQWRREADQVAQFVEEECETGSHCKATSAILFNRYKEWAMNSGIKFTLNRNNFTTRLCKLGFEPARGKGGDRMIAGIQPLPVASWQAVDYDNLDRVDF